MTVKVLMVAEKPSICTAIASALSKGQMESRGRTPPVHEFHASFQGKDAFYRVTSVVGHVFSMDFPTQYQNWELVDPVELFHVPVVSPPEGKGGIVKHLEREAAGMDFLVLWLDCDREGENICFEVIRCVSKAMQLRPVLTGGKLDSRILRAHFSAVTPRDIDRAMSSLGQPNLHESLAVEARQELDLKIGVAFSRFQTRYFQGKYGGLDSAVISYGPCQTPTLGFCVDRHDEIKSFTPEPFWGLDVCVEAGGCMLRLEWARKRVFDQEVAAMLLHTLRADGEKREAGGFKELIVTRVSSTETRRMRPQAMNTITLLKLSSSVLGIGPQAAMRAAEHLYLSGLVSYPRTESTAYPESFDIRGTLQEVCNHPSLGIFASELISQGPSRARRGVDAGDHPPLTPVGLPLHPLSGDQSRVYDLITRHFLASVSKDARFLITTAEFSSTRGGAEGGERFSCRGKEELDPGFMRVYGRDSHDAEGADGSEQPNQGEGRLPSHLQQGMQCRVVDAKVQEGSTTVPRYLSESELIGLMEKNGIGTDASIATHVNNILVRNYVTLGSGRTLIPTPLGVVLVHGYHRIDSALVLPEVRSTIEQFCNLVAQGKASKEEVVAHSLRNFQRKFVYFTNNVGRMDSLFEASFSPLAATGKFLSKCGKCLRYMRFIPLKPQRLYCQNCEETYSLPQNGTIKLYKEIRCPLDNFELVLFSLGNSVTAQGKSFPLCPCCYNHPPSFEDLISPVQRHVKKMYPSIQKDDSRGVISEETAGTLLEVRRAMGCNQCLHATCKQSAAFNGMCPCPGAIAAAASAIVLGASDLEASRAVKGRDGNVNDEESELQDCPGTLVLDLNSKPNWKLACNHCHTLLRFHGHIHNITPLPLGIRGQCAVCGTRLAQVEFSKAQVSPLASGEHTIVGCIVCDDTLNALTEIVTGRSVHLLVQRRLRQLRGGGRGKGLAGRGDGRGRTRDVKMSFSDF